MENGQLQIYWIEINKEKKMKRILNVLWICLLLCAVLVGCTERSVGDTTVERTKIRMTHPNAGEMDTIWMKRFEAHVEEVLPEVDLEFIHMSGSELISKVTIMTQGNDWPDIITAQDIADFATLGIIEPIDSYLETSEVINLANYHDAGVQYANYQGHQYYAPVLVIPYALLVNENRLAEVGADKSELKTWEDLVNVSKQMSDTGKAAYGFCGSVPRLAFRDFYIMAASNELYPDTLGLPKSKDKLVECLEMYKLLQPYTIENSLSVEWGDLHKYIAEDNIGFIGTGGYYAGFITGMKENATDYLRPISFPKGPSAEKSTSLVGSLGYALTSGSENKDLAWKVIEEAMTPEFLYMYGVQNIPALKETDHDLMIKYLREYFPDKADIFAEIIYEWSDIIAAGGVLQPSVPGQTEFERSFQEHLAKLLDNEITAEEMAVNFAEDFNEIVSSYQ